MCAYILMTGLFICVCQFLAFATFVGPPVGFHELTSHSERALYGTLYRLSLWNKTGQKRKQWRKKENIWWCLVSSSYFGRLCGRTAGALSESHVCGCLLQSWIVFDICARQICLGLVVFWDKKSTEARCTTKMWEGSRWGCLWLIFPLATWQGEDKALIMNCDTLMSLSGSDNTWSALLAFNLWYQWGKLQIRANKAYMSRAKKEHDF